MTAAVDSRRFAHEIGTAIEKEIVRWLADLRERLIRSGRAWITTTVLRGRRVLRVTMMKPRTTEAHIDTMLDALREV